MQVMKAVRERTADSPGTFSGGSLCKERLQTLRRWKQFPPVLRALSPKGCVLGLETGQAQSSGPPGPNGPWKG